MRAMAHENRKEIKRFVKFASVGALGSITDFAILNILIQVFDTPLVVANACSFTAAVIQNFTLNRLWTFKDSTNPNVLGQFAQYFVINIGGLLLNNLLIWVFEPIFASIISDDLAYLPAKVVASLVAVIFNFLANRYVTFRDVGGHDQITPSGDTVSESSD